MKKSVTTRIKITKTGKVLRRKMAQDHFRAKKSRRQIQRRQGLVALPSFLIKKLINL